MRHNPALLLAFGTAAASSSTSWLKDAAPKLVVEESWAAPARQTNAGGEANTQQMALGWSPRPTEAPPSPKALMGRMLVPRLDGFTLGQQTCGFDPDGGDFGTLVCRVGVCTRQSSYAGCCDINGECSAIQTTCIGYAASMTGACDLLANSHTLCCDSSRSPACFTWVISTSAQTDKSSIMYTLLDCSSTAGRGTLLDYDPEWSRTHRFVSTSSRSEPPTSTSTGDSDRGGSSNESSTNVGAIAGGTVGGIAALGLVATAAFLLIRRRRNASGAAGGGPSSSAPPPPPMAQQPPGYAPMSPQQGYDPHMSAYSQQGLYPQQFQGQYPPQQQYQYPTPTASTSPPPHTSPSPGLGIIKPGETLPQQALSPPSELATVNPVGAETNRAELG